MLCYFQKKTIKYLVSTSIQCEKKKDGPVKKAVKKALPYASVIGFFSLYGKYGLFVRKESKYVFEKYAFANN